MKAKDMTRNTSFSLAAALFAIANCWSSCVYAYDGEGATYVSPDRTQSYSFLSKIAKYQYVYPKKRLVGQKFSPEQSDLVPNSIVNDCSDANFRCVSLDDQAMAIPRRSLTPTDKYFTADNSLDVVKCLRGTKSLCQVALIRAKRVGNRGHESAKGADASSQRQWLLYFLYNEDFGVTSFGTAPPRGDDAPSQEVLAGAKQFILAGNDGLLKP